MKRIIAIVVPSAFLMSLSFALPAQANTVTITTMPSITISGTSITTTQSVWGISSGTPTYDIGNDGRIMGGNAGEFADWVLACSTTKVAVTTPTAASPHGCSTIYGANTGYTHPTSTSVAYTGDSGSRTLLDLTNKFIAVQSVISDGNNNFFMVRSATVPASGGSSGSSSEESSTENPLPSPKIPFIDQFSSGAMLISPGTNAILNGSRLNCTTSVSINDKPTTFTYQTLVSGQGQLSIAMPKDLAAGKHRLSMDSCGGSVVYDNMLMVSKAPVKLELNMASGIDRGIGLVQLRAFVRQHRADFNSVECVADASLSAQKRIATSLVESFCKRAMGLLASPNSHTTAIKSDNKADSILLTVTLSNK